MSKNERRKLMMELADACDDLEFAEPASAEFDDAEGRYRKAHASLQQLSGNVGAVDE